MERENRETVAGLALGKNIHAEGGGASLRYTEKERRGRGLDGLILRVQLQSVDIIVGQVGAPQGGQHGIGKDLRAAGHNGVVAFVQQHRVAQNGFDLIHEFAQLSGGGAGGQSALPGFAQVEQLLQAVEQPGGLQGCQNGGRGGDGALRRDWFRETADIQSVWFGGLTGQEKSGPPQRNRGSWRHGNLKIRVALQLFAEKIKWNTHKKAPPGFRTYCSRKSRRCQ